MTGRCPHCGEIVNTIEEEIDHMQDAHPEIVEEIMTSAGFARDEEGKWIDLLADDS